MQDIDPKNGNMDNAKNINSRDRENLNKYLGRLKDDLEGVTIESKFNDSADVIVERWQRLAGIAK